MHQALVLYDPFRINQRLFIVNHLHSSKSELFYFVRASLQPN